MNNHPAPRFISSVLFVKDINISKRFYTAVLGQKIEFDFGKYVGFKDGFGIWEGGYALQTIYSKSKDVKSFGKDNYELYFEIVDLDALYEKLKMKGVDFIHSVQEHPWGQRAFRIHDPDGHILEFAEPMSDVVHRYHKQGLTPEEIAETTGMPLEHIHTILKKE
jgi:catechol 2,3-dioxygenase-like lactoylglutathione lyase family enzyme